MQTTYLIRIHSFVDLITNSSTELFISANDKSAETVRAVIDNILSLGGSTLKANDLFKIELVVDEDSYHGDNGPAKAIRLTALSDSPEAKMVAKTLSNLTGLFSIDAEYN